MPTTMTQTRLPLELRAEMIDYLVRNEKPKSAQDANALALDWDRHDDASLIEAYNYNRLSNGLPERRFEREGYR